MTNDTITAAKPVIIIEEKPDVIPGQPEGEVPVITIEESGSAKTASSRPRRMRLATVLFAVMASATVCILLIGGWLAYQYFFDFGVPVGTTPSENIAKLERTANHGDTGSGVTVSGDSILGVAMNFYKINNLKAEITLSQPDTTDTGVMLYTRCSDYTAAGQYLGSLVVDGKVLQTDRSRVGYCAMAGVQEKMKKN